LKEVMEEQANWIGRICVASSERSSGAPHRICDTDFRNHNRRRRSSARRSHPKTARAIR
jgi:hypothetical protein